MDNKINGFEVFDDFMPGSFANSIIPGKESNE
jgi:hypothetical protein